MPKNKNKKTNDSKALPLDGMLVFDYKPTIESINGLMKQSAESVLKIGEVLYDAKTESTRLGAKDDYTAMFNHLRFTKATGDKFISMYTDKNIKNYIQHCPPYWNSIYSHLRGWTTEEWDKMIEEGELNFMSTSKDISDLKQKVLGDRARVIEEAEARKKKALEKEKADDDKSNDTPTEDYVPKGTSNVSEKLKDTNIKVENPEQEKTLTEEQLIKYAENNDTDYDDGYYNDKQKKFQGNIVEVKFNGYNVKEFNENRDKHLATLNTMIADIKSYAKDCVKKHNMSNAVRVYGMEMSLSDLGIKLEDAKSKEDDVEVKDAA